MQNKTPFREKALEVVAYLTAKLSAHSNDDLAAGRGGINDMYKGAKAPGGDGDVGFFRNTKQPKRVDEAVSEHAVESEVPGAAGPTAPAGDEQEAGGLDTQPIDHNEGIARIFCPAY